MILSVLSSIGFILFALGLLIGLVLVPLGLPGTWLIVSIAFLYSLFRDFQMGRNDFWVLLVVIFLALLAELLELGIGVIGSRKLKVSNGAIIASIAGGIIGAIIGVPVLLIGGLIGLFIGVFAGAFIYEWVASKDWRRALQGALATFFCRITSLFVKTFVAFMMVIYLLTKTL
ncbi:MAG: DUF456 domain-containing protein [Deltaproteobacteria bacterium]|nr:DUF456 domain-containing protein [Deltaproteobacteria bacterium]